MKTQNRRTFIKQAALLTTTAATARNLIASVNASPSILSTQVREYPFFAQARDHPEIIAHRGGDGQWPGETLYAYKEAQKIADVLEMDVYLTKDRQLALMHDKNIRTTTSRAGSIHKFTLAELQQLSAAYKWQEDGSKKFYHKKLQDLPAEFSQKDLRVPSLREVFETFPNMRMVIEMKPADSPDFSPAKELCGLIRKFDMTDRVLVGSFSGRYTEEFRGLCPEVATSLSFLSGDLASLIKGAPEVTAVVVPYWIIKKFKQSFLGQLKDRNVKLYAWTVNNSDDMNSMIAREVDGIITDYPGALRGLLGRVSPTPG